MASEERRSRFFENRFSSSIEDPNRQPTQARYLTRPDLIRPESLRLENLPELEQSEFAKAPKDHSTQVNKDLGISPTVYSAGASSLAPIAAQDSSAGDIATVASGAMSGAALGTAVAPGIGTAAGAAVGAGIGLIGASGRKKARREAAAKALRNRKIQFAAQTESNKEAKKQAAMSNIIASLRSAFLGR